MNLADSVKKVLKSRSQNIFTDFWKVDLQTNAKDLGGDIARLGRSGKQSFKHLKNVGLKVNIKELVDAGADTLLIFKVLPKRVKSGFLHFKDEFVLELEHLPDQKQKTIFCLKVIGALTSFTLGAIYSVKKGKNDFALAGLKRRNAFTQFLVAELVFKISQIFIYRFLVELEKEITDPKDLKNVRFFKDLIFQRSQQQAEVEGEIAAPMIGDRAIEMVEDLKRFIMTGK
jgi:hypothetical protein